MSYFSSFGRKMLKGQHYEIKDTNVVHFFFREIGSPSSFRKVSQSSAQFLLKSHSQSNFKNTIIT